jgi:hypothetical protein
MKRPSIRLALSGLLVLIAASIVALTLTSYSGLSKLNQNSEEVGRYWMSRMVIAREIKGNFNLMRLAYSRLIMAATPDEVQTEIDGIKQTDELIRKLVTDYEAGVRTEKGRELINAFKP